MGHFSACHAQNSTGWQACCELFQSSPPTDPCWPMSPPILLPLTPTENTTATSTLQHTLDNWDAGDAERVQQWIKNKLGRWAIFHLAIMLWAPFQQLDTVGSVTGKI